MIFSGAFIRLVLPLCGIFVLCSCGMDSGEKGAQDTEKIQQVIIDLGDGEGQKNLTLEKNQEFIIRLKGNPTTGYSWVYQATQDDRVAIPAGPERFSPAEGNDGKVGAGGYFEFPFKTVTPGEKKIVFIYRRPWEKDVEPARTAELTINVPGK